MLELDPKKTALVFIDLQKGILAMPVAPHSAADVVAGAVKLSRAAKAAGASLVIVNVSGIDLRHPVDASQPGGERPADWAELHPDIDALPADVRITKRQWGAFYGTELDLQLRRRGITTIVLGGVATNFGVEQTAREAWQHNYAVVVAEDLSTSVDDEMHRFSIGKILPRISRIRTASEIRSALDR